MSFLDWPNEEFSENFSVFRIVWGVIGSFWTVGEIEWRELVNKKRIKKQYKIIKKEYRVNNR